MENNVLTADEYTKIYAVKKHISLDGTKRYVLNAFTEAEIKYMEFQRTDNFFQLKGLTLVDQRVKYLPEMWETRVQSLNRKDPWRRKWQPTLVLLPGKSHRRRSLVGYSPRGCKESDTTSLSLSRHKPGGASGKEPACRCLGCKRRRFYPWVRKIP